MNYLSPITNMEVVAARAEEIQDLLERVEDRHVMVKDMEAHVRSGEWLLWLVTDEAQVIHALAITTFVYYPRLTAFRIIFTAGDNEDWANRMGELETFAAANGAAEVEVLGRKGWERVLKARGFEFQNITLTKRIQ